MSDTRTFMAAILRRPTELGAIAPSSKALAKRAVTPVPTAGSPIVIELGPGGGVVTDAIHARLPAEGRLLAVEHSDEMVRHLRRTRPWLNVIHGDATELVDLMRAEGVHQADAIISTLPWTLFNDDTQVRLLNQITSLLTPGGKFVTILTLTAWPFPGARRFRRRLNQAFGDVVTTSPVWGNVPPALLYMCGRPQHIPVRGHDGAAEGVGEEASAGPAEAKTEAQIEAQAETGAKAGVEAGAGTAGSEPADLPRGHG